MTETLSTQLPESTRQAMLLSNTGEFYKRKQALSLMGWASWLVAKAYEMDDNLSSIDDTALYMAKSKRQPIDYEFDLAGMPVLPYQQLQVQPYLSSVYRGYTVHLNLQYALAPTPNKIQYDDEVGYFGIYKYNRNPKEIIVSYSNDLSNIPKDIFIAHCERLLLKELFPGQKLKDTETPADAILAQSIIKAILARSGD